MALHLPTHGRSDTALHSQKIASTVVSALIVLLTLTELLLILHIIRTSSTAAPAPAEIIAFHSAKESVAEVKEVEPTHNEVPPAPAAPTSSVASVIATEMAAELSIPTFDTIAAPALDFSANESFTESWVESSTPAASQQLPQWNALPKALSARCAADKRLQILLKSGGSAECETAVVRSLEWLQQTQNKEGSWCRRKQVGLTGLALLCFLGHCETPYSEKFGGTVENAILYLVTVGTENQGRLASNYSARDWPYEHAIATYALAEAYTLCNEADIHIPQLKEVVTSAAQHILDHQHPASGGWDYSYATASTRGGDSSLTCWHLQALKACKLTKISQLSPLEKSAKKGLLFLQGCQGKDGGVYYTASDPQHASMTGAALLCYQQWGKARHSLARKAAKHIDKHVRFDFHSSDSDLYAHYYYTQCLFNIGGSTWKNYNSNFRDSLLSGQLENGSWQPPGGGNAINGHQTRAYTSASKSARVYRTALATLMLEVYYRYLPSH